MNYVVDHTLKSQYHRPGGLGEKTTITVHNTGVPNVPAINFRKSLGRVDNVTYSSFHIVVDTQQAIECIPLNEIAYHCANKEGNAHSIGIEVCEIDGAEIVAAELIAKMLVERGWGVDRVTTHKYWNGKNCPRLLLPKWDWFIGLIQEKMNALSQPAQPIQQKPIVIPDSDNIIKLPIGYDEFLVNQDRMIMHVSPDTYLSYQPDGVYAVHNGNWNRIFYYEYLPEQQRRIIHFSPGVYIDMDNNNGITLVVNGQYQKLV